MKVRSTTKAGRSLGLPAFVLSAPNISRTPPPYLFPPRSNIDTSSFRRAVSDSPQKGARPQRGRRQRNSAGPTSTNTFIDTIESPGTWTTSQHAYHRRPYRNNQRQCPGILTDLRINGILTIVENGYQYRATVHSSSRQEKLIVSGRRHSCTSAYVRA